MKAARSARQQLALCSKGVDDGSQVCLTTLECYVARFAGTSDATNPPSNDINIT